MIHYRLTIDSLASEKSDGAAFGVLDRNRKAPKTNSPPPDAGDG